MIYVRLKSYLSQLEEAEMRKPVAERRKVPTLADIARDTGLTYANISRTANNRVSGIRFKTASNIIKSVRTRGFEMQLTDLIYFYDEDE